MAKSKYSTSLNFILAAFRFANKTKKSDGKYRIGSHALHNILGVVN